MGTQGWVLGRFLSVNSIREIKKVPGSVINFESYLVSTMDLRHEPEQPVDGKLVTPDPVVGDLSTLRGVEVPQQLRVHELLNWCYALRATVQNELVHSIELTVKRDGEDMFSYVVDGPQPLWLSRALVSAIENARAIYDIEALVTIWKKALSAPHLRWEIVSPRIGAAHDALFIPRSLPVCPSIEEFVRNPLISSKMFLCQRDESGRSTAFLGRVFPAEGVAALVTSDIDPASGRHNVGSFVLPCYPWEFLPTDRDTPDGMKRLDELKWRLEHDGADSLFGALYAGRWPVIVANPSENVREQEEDALRRMRSPGAPHVEFTGVNGVSRVELHLGVKQALIVIRFDSQVEQSNVSLRFYCGDQSACLSGAQIAFLISRAELLASGDSATRFEVAAEIGNPAVRSALVVDRSQKKDSDLSRAGRPLLGALECFAWAPDTLVSSLVGDDLGRRLAALSGVAVKEQRLAQGLLLGELLAGTQSFVLELPKRVRESAPHLWHSMQVWRHRDGTWVVKASNDMGGGIEAEVFKPGKSGPQSGDDELLRICEVFADGSEVGEAALRFTIDDVAQRGEADLSSADRQNTTFRIRSFGVPALHDSVGQKMHAYAGRLLARLQPLQVGHSQPQGTQAKSQQGRVVGTFRPVGLSSGELALEHSALPFFIRLVFKEGKLDEMAIGDCRNGTPQMGKWSYFVRFQDLRIALGSPNCLMLEEGLKDYFDNTGVSGDLAQRKRSADPSKIPVVIALTTLLAEMFPDQLSVQRTSKRLLVIRPERPE